MRAYRPFRGPTGRDVAMVALGYFMARADPAIVADAVAVAKALLVPAKEADRGA